MKRKRTTDPRLLLGALVAAMYLAACGGEEEAAPYGEPASSAQQALSSYNAVLAVYEKTLDDYARVIKAEGKTGDCKWEVKDAQFSIEWTGVHLKGTLTGKCALALKSSLGSGVVQPAGNPVPKPQMFGKSQMIKTKLWVPIQEVPFSLPVSATHSNGFLKLTASSQPVAAKWLGGTTAFSVNLSPYYSTNLYIGKAAFNTDHRSFVAQAQNVKVTTHPGALFVHTLVTL